MKNNYHRYDGIQALRFIAALMVVVMHSIYYATERLGAESHSWGVGAKGVDIFFVISGFVMIVSSRNLIGLPDGWRIFLNKRLDRIVPLYWGATSFKLVVLLLMSSVILHADLNWWNIFKSYFFIPSINIDGQIKPFLGVGWTLVFEMFFYITFTTALFLRRNIYIFVGIILLLFSFFSLIRGENYSPWLFLMDPIILEFYMGMLIGLFVLRNMTIPPIYAILLFATSAMYIFFAPNFFQLHRFIQSGIPAAALVWSLVSLEGFLQGRIPKVVIFFGAASYALYLFHPLSAPLAPALLKKLSMENFTVSVLCSIAIAMTTAAVVHRFFEIPCTNFLRKYRVVKSTPDHGSKNLSSNVRDF